MRGKGRANKNDYDILQSGLTFAWPKRTADMTPSKTHSTAPEPGTRPFRLAVLRGLTRLAPPLLTVAILLWIGYSVRRFVLDPMTYAARTGLVWALADVRKGTPDVPPGTTEIQTRDGPFVRVAANEFVPQEVVEIVRQHLGNRPLPADGRAIYRQYVDIQYVDTPWFTPVVLLLFVLLLYLLGRFLAQGIGGFFFALFERLMGRVPLVRKVYPSVKQVTSLLFSDQEVTALRIVAVEFPSKGLWTLGFVTGESLPELNAAAAEPVLSVHIPSPPVLKGSVITVRKSETIEMNMTVDQAVQFVVSCGILRPPQQIRKPA